MDDRRIIGWSIASAATLLIGGAIVAVLMARPSNNVAGQPSTEPYSPTRARTFPQPPRQPATQWTGGTNLKDVHPSLFVAAANGGWKEADIAKLRIALQQAMVRGDITFPSLLVAEITVGKSGPILISRSSLVLDGKDFTKIPPLTQYDLPEPREALVSYRITMKESELQKAGILKPGADVSIKGRLQNVDAWRGSDRFLGVKIEVTDATFE